MSDETILLIEDEEPIRELVKMTLEAAGFTHISTAADGEAGLRAALFSLPNLILLDLMLPGIDGLTVCRRLKEESTTRNIPVIMLTAKSEESDIVLGLEMGAVDYITKPFSRKILVARVRAQLRAATDHEESRELRCTGLVINDELHTVRLDGQPVDLTVSEYDILKLFAAHPGRVYTRNLIISSIKGDGYPVTERSVDVQIVNLRHKLGEWGANIETVWGVGYRLKAEVAL